MIYLKDFIKKLEILSKKEAYIQYFKKEIWEMFGAIFYYLALEQVPDTGQAREIYIQALNELHSSLSEKVPVEFYDIWENYPERDQGFGEYNLRLDGLKFEFSTKDIGIFSQNSEKYGTPSRKDDDTLEGHLVTLRSERYKGIIGSDYEKFYIDTILYYAKGTLNGSTPNMLPILEEKKVIYLNSIKNFILGKKV